MAKKQKLVDVDIDMDDATFMVYAKEAHKRDITFNQLITEVLQKALDKEDEKSYAKKGN